MAADKTSLIAALAVVALLRVPAATPDVSAAIQAAKTPHRIVCVVPAVTEMLFAVGAGPQIVGVGSFDKYPPETERLPRVGALLDPDVERILSLKPDFAVVFASQIDLQKQLEHGGIAVFGYRDAGLAEIASTIRQLGQRTGHESQGEQVAAGIEGGLNAIRKAVAGRPHPRTLLLFGRDRLTLRGMYASGGVGFLHDMLDVAGADNVFADVKLRAVQATTETILARRPEVILEVRASSEAPPPGDLASEIAVWRALPSLPAVRSGRIQFIVDDRVVIPGPRIVEGTRLLVHALHPEV